MFALTLVNIPDAGTRWFDSAEEAYKYGHGTGFQYNVTPVAPDAVVDYVFSLSVGMTSNMVS